MGTAEITRKRTAEHRPEQNDGDIFFEIGEKMVRKRERNKLSTTKTKLYGKKVGERTLKIW